VLEVPGDARHVLDVGCGGGGTGAALKRRQQVEVCGIEVDQAAAARAERVLDTVVCGDVEEVSLAFPPGYFDCIIYGDILEHLRWPGDVLQVHRRVLADDGRVIVTIPNVQYFGVSLRVLLGRWQYAPMGIMDLTHLRFFTRRGAIAMLSAQGYKVVRLRPDYGPRRWLRVVDALTLGLVRGLLAYKYVIVAIPAAGMSCSG
jgi:SAM-dependent methyltransferase